MIVSASEAEVERLRAAIRAHRDQRGDDRCWMDDETLYAALPEGYAPPARDADVELANCRRFIASRHNNPATVYVSPQREIERLSGALRAWRTWAQFVWLGGGPVEQSDDELRRAVCDRVDVQRSCR